MKKQTHTSFFPLKTFSVFLFLLSFKLIFAQGYTPLVVENAQWIQTYDNEFSTPGVLDEFFSYTLAGDTLFAGHTYKKVIYRKWDVDDPVQQTYAVVPNSNRLVAFLREDVTLKKVYGIILDSLIPEVFHGYNQCPVGTEYLLYDFDLNVNDTLDFCLGTASGNNIVNAIGSAFLFGKNRKYFLATYGDFMEGIGSQNGLFAYIINGLSGKKFEVNWHCVGTDSDCGIPTLSTSELKNISFKIYPNPFTAFLKIDSPTLIDGLEYVIYDMQGVKVLSGTLSKSQENEVNTEQLKSGVYLIALKEVGVKQVIFKP